MTGNDGGSTVAQGSNISDASEVIRRAKARQSTDDRDAAIPDETTVDATVDSFFDDSGSLVGPEQVEASAETTTVEEPEAILEVLNPDKLDKIDEKFEDLPGTREELVEFHAEKERQNVDGTVTVTEAGGSAPLEVTVHQSDVPTFEERLESLNTDNEVEGHVDKCDKCGEENVAIVEKQVLQTRAADESGTELAHLDCGCTTRHTD